jgi:hypothetical protein
MYVVSNVYVYEDITKVRLNSRETSCVMDMDDCKLNKKGNKRRTGDYCKLVLVMFITKILVN